MSKGREIYPPASDSRGVGWDACCDERKKARSEPLAWPGTKRAQSRGWATALVLALLLAAGARAQNPQRDLTELSLETLMNMQVTSASKKEQRFLETATALYVITQEDIRRSGATSIPELLRMVPGLSVAQIDANKWAITARGFNNRFANKMLVLMDGRTVYAPLFSGVYWDVQDTLLEDIERIEVIRGPGATLWGSNAVNGVINIITKHSKDTQGALVSAGAGNLERGFGDLRYGTTLASHGSIRFFARYFNRANSSTQSGTDASDAWDLARAGFRSDWNLGRADSLTVQGDYYVGSAGETVPYVASILPPVKAIMPDRTHLRDINLLGRWDHTFSPRSETSLQLYFDDGERRETQLSEDRHTWDVDFQHHAALGERHDVVWGLGYRFTTDDTQGGLTVSFTPEKSAKHLYSGFVQDEIVFPAARVRITLGSKLEHNEFAGFEMQPNARFHWTIHPNHAIWAAVSHSHRTPSRADRDIRINTDAFLGPGDVPTIVSLLDNPKMRSEELLATEFGYRTQWRKRLSIDLATFLNSYGNVRTAVPNLPRFESTPSPPHLVIPFIFENASEGKTYGLEVTSTWQATHACTITGWDSRFHEIIHPKEGFPSASKSTPNPDSPENQGSLRSYLNLPRNLECDTALYFVGRYHSLGVPGYVRWDTRIGWRPRESLKLSLVLQNLQAGHHPEFTNSAQSVVGTEVKRSIYGKLTWGFSKKASVRKDQDRVAPEGTE